jgi:glycerophosphoryl diester phosphodiesterase
MTIHPSIPTTAILLLAIHTSAFAAEPTPLIVAHRGLLQYAPENTLANFRACLELRLGFEFDVQRTKDGHLVCIHDDTVDRTTNGTGNVADLTLDQIRQLDAGGWFDPKFAGEKVPTVEEVLKLIADQRQKEVLIAVDLKAEAVEQDVVRLADKHKVLDRLLFIGRTITEPQVRERIKAISTKAQTATVANNADEFPKALAAPNTDCIYFRYVPPKEQMEAVRGAGKRSFIAGATVSGNVPDNWRQAAEVGIDGILTDFPFELRAMLRKGRGDRGIEIKVPTSGTGRRGAGSSLRSSGFFVYCMGMDAPKLSGGAQCGPLHAVDRWRSATRRDVLTPRNEAPPCRFYRL